MGLKGYRLWVMGQLDSTCRAPPLQEGIQVHEVQPAHRVVTHGCQIGYMEWNTLTVINYCLGDCKITPQNDVVTWVLQNNTAK